jgi:hypothetical protein
MYLAEGILAIETDKWWRRFLQAGWLGLFEQDKTEFVVSIHVVAGPRWGARQTYEQKLLVEVFGRLAGPLDECRSNMGKGGAEAYESGFIRSGFQPSAREAGDDQVAVGSIAPACP